MGKTELSFEAIGTRWFISYSSENSVDKKALAITINYRIKEFDKNYSRFRTDSLVTKMAKKPGRYSMPDYGYELLKFYNVLYDATKGYVTPLIGQVMEDAGYDAEYSFKEKTLTSPFSWEETISYSKSSINLKRSAILDFGAAGKGYLVDIIGDILVREGVNDFLINAGGDILYKSSTEKSLLVGLEDPNYPKQILGTVNITNQSICASSGSRRKWGKYNHIINPKTLVSPSDTIATWVIAKDAITADGLATALFFTKPSILRKHWDFSYAVLKSDMELEYSKDFPVSSNVSTK